ncbi:MAG TPA: EAL domain-containing protein, partial [Acidimicrobiales bacterium]|nr:EAL domain-containing protein [Acidimicrobiales bacterium]
MIIAVIAVALAGGIRAGMGHRPVVVVAVAGALAVPAVAMGVLVARNFHRRVWTEAWALIGLGLLFMVGSELVETLGVSGLPTDGGLGTVFDAGGALLTVAGLAALLHQRLPGREAEALAESSVMALALAFVTLALIVVPRQGWHPAHQIAALAAPLLDLVVLWTAGSLVQLTERHPTSYRFLVAGYMFLFFAHAMSSAQSFVSDSLSPVAVETVVLWGVCVWAMAFVHPSQKAPFDPVPLRPTRPSAVRVGLLVGSALVVPAVLSTQSAVIVTRERVLVVAATLLPLLVLLYLLRQVFTHAAAEYRAQHDPLTGVCNRVLFEDRLRQSLAQSERTRTSVAVMFLDLDRFKDINDSLGHAVGNQLLQAVVKRLQGCLREQDTLARFGGDEFTLLIPDSGPKDDSVVKVAERILERFSDPFTVGSRQLSVKASVGVAVSPFDGADADTLLKHADTAMYQAKAAGRNTFEVFDSAMSARARLRFALEDSLRAAVECGRLAVHYQPKLDIATGRIAGVEALARWQHPRLGFIPPWAFIPLAEESSLVATLGKWVLEQACAQARRWHEMGLEGASVAVNLSPRQFGHQPVVDMVKEALRVSRLDPNLLELEVTESVLMEHMGEVATSLDDLRAMGVRCSIDDFGTGYNALTYLAEMPVDAIKIDKSFVARIDQGGDGCPIVGAVIALAHSLNLRVVAEGVETDDQLRFLEANACDQVQGYRFSPPVPAVEMEALLANPARLFTDWREEVAAMPLPMGVVSPARFEALLDSVLQEGHWPTGMDSEVIEAVLAALQPDELRRTKDARVLRPFSTRLAVGTLAGLASVTGGLAAANALPRSMQSAATEILGTDPGQAASGTGPADPEKPAASTSPVDG